jgi:hypothetical protein
MINKSLDQPWTSDPVNLGPFTGNPLHSACIFNYKITSLGHGKIEQILRFERVLLFLSG